MKTLSLIVGAASVAATVLVAAQHPAMPAGLSHEDHLKQLQKDEELKRRGALAMGFDQDATQHHFLLRRSGGAIVVTANDGNDAASVARIRGHLREIAAAFAGGEFDTPVATHGELPPGAALMAANRASVTYRYEERLGGASVIIEANDGATIRAIHEFLRYQIVEHKTGDPMTPPS